MIESCKESALSFFAMAADFVCQMEYAIHAWGLDDGCVYGCGLMFFSVSAHFMLNR